MLHPGMGCAMISTWQIPASVMLYWQITVFVGCYSWLMNSWMYMGGGSRGINSRPPVLHVISLIICMWSMLFLSLLSSLPLHPGFLSG